MSIADKNSRNMPFPISVNFQYLYIVLENKFWFASNTHPLTIFSTEVGFSLVSITFNTPKDFMKVKFRYLNIRMGEIVQYNIKPNESIILHIKPISMA